MEAVKESNFGSLHFGREGTRAWSRALLNESLESPFTNGDLAK